MERKDGDLAALILERLDEAGLGPYALRVRCVGGRVTLQGIVDVLAEKNAAGRVAARTPGVTAVENAITVCTDGSIDDGDVAAEVAEELAAQPFGPAVGAEVNSGRVRLVGQVPTVAAQAQAMATASRARGVREVASELSLAPEIATDDVSLANAVELALADGLGPEAGRVSVKAHNGAIVLEGRATAETAGRAEALASQVPGVRSVRNSLTRPEAPHDEVIRALLDRIGANPFLNGAPLSFRVQEGVLIAEGEVDTREGKRDLERLLQEAREEYRLVLRGIDNRVRFDR
ncbi:MAG: BON domain-containing protein [Bacteroidota bacterium]